MGVLVSCQFVMVLVMAVEWGTHELSVEFGQPGLTVVVKDQHGVDHRDCSDGALPRTDRIEYVKSNERVKSNSLRMTLIADSSVCLDWPVRVFSGELHGLHLPFPHEQLNNEGIKLQALNTCPASLLNIKPSP